MDYCTYVISPCGGEFRDGKIVFSFNFFALGLSGDIPEAATHCEVHTTRD